MAASPAVAGRGNLAMYCSCMSRTPRRVSDTCYYTEFLAFTVKSDSAFSAFSISTAGHGLLDEWRKQLAVAR